MSLDSAGGRLVPDRSQRKWMIAQVHIVERDGQLDEAALNAELDGKEYIKPSTEFLGAKEIYDETIKQLKKSDPSPNNLVDFFLNEKSLNVQKFEDGSSVSHSSEAAQ